MFLLLRTTEQFHPASHANQRMRCPPEGLVDGPVPADEGHGREEEEPEDGQTEVHAVLRAGGEVSQAGQHVE